jgi:hypothetical protein
MVEDADSPLRRSPRRRRPWKEDDMVEDADSSLRRSPRQSSSEMKYSAASENLRGVVASFTPNVQLLAQTEVLILASSVLR